MLKQRALSATLWSAIEQIGARGLSTIFMLVFARYLSAEEFGIFAAATLIMRFASTIAQFGLNTVIIQRPELEMETLSTAFWMALGAAIIIAVTLAILATPLASLFGDPAIASLVQVLAAGMVISAASAIVTALLRRELNMKALARRTLLANAMSGVIAAPFILNGFGAWGLVIQSVGGTVLTLVLTVLLIGWPVRWVFDPKAAREMLRFGAPVVGNDFLRQYSNSSPQLYVGIFLGPEALGILAMGMRIANLFMSLLGSTLINVAFPLVAEVGRKSPERVGEIFLRLVHVAGAVVFAVFILAIVLRGPMITLILGNSWRDTAPVLLYLLLAGLLMNLNYINNAVFLARGAPRPLFFFSVLRALVGTLLLLIATPFGLVAASAAYALRSILVDPIQLRYLLSILNLNVSDYLQKLKGPAVSGIILAGAGIFLIDFLAAYPPLIILVSTGCGALSSYFLALLVIDKPLFAELKGLLGRQRSPS